MGHQKNSSNTITLNGRVYDVVTGHPVQNGPTKHETPKHKPHKIDEVKPTHASTHRSVDAVRKTHNKQRRPQHSKTLMRNLVKKPKSMNFHASGSIAAVASSVTVVQSEPVVLQAKDRSSRAKHISKSKLVSKFGPLGSQPSFVMSVQELPVKSHPESKKPTGKATTTATQKTNELFAKALSKVDQSKDESKPHKAHKKKGSRVLKASAASLAILLVAGVVVMKTSSNVEFRLASSRAGINAVLPGYSPDGYSKSGPIEYAPGQVSVRYGSNSDNRSYTITQKASSWNSQALLNTKVLGASTDYQTVESKGKTVFIYNDGHATWVDGGILYEINGQGSLSQPQILEIVDSI